jgi:NAD(P)-dependent dehydrogenase (short-subunit alcohol dehydrogenase family)
MQDRKISKISLHLSLLSIRLPHSAGRSSQNRRRPSAPQLNSNQFTDRRSRSFFGEEIMRLANKVAVITGGNSGIGLATAKEFCRHGARVVIFGRDQTSLDRAVAEIGAGTQAVQGDVRNLGDLDRLYEEVADRYEKFDVLVANAGIARFAPAAELSEELFDEVCDVNFKGTFFTVQRALPYLRDGASVILVGAADTDKQGRPLTSVYNGSKAAVRALARSLSAELLPRRLRVNVLSPGMTDTPIITRSGGIPGATPQEIAAAITELIPVKRRGTAEEMAQAMLFLASDDSAYCLGVELVLDGGLTQIVTG